MEVKKYEEILTEIDRNDITYLDLLRTEEWREKRKEILNRDKNTCCNCPKLGSIIKDKKAYRKKTPVEIEQDRNEIDRIYKELLENFISFNESFGIQKPYDLPKKAEIETLTLDLEPTFLHVHHKYYIRDRNPWEYNNDALITVCNDCHQKIHETSQIPIFSDNSLTRESTVPNCSRCGGLGYINEYHYYLAGICFKCNGRGF